MMLKNIFITIFIFLAAFNLYSEDLWGTNKRFIFIDTHCWIRYIELNNEDFIIADGIYDDNVERPSLSNSIDAKTIFSWNRNDIKLHDDGFYRLTVLEGVKETDKLYWNANFLRSPEKRIVLMGDSLFFLNYINITHFFNSREEIENYKPMDQFDYHPIIETFNIKSVTASSSLTEGSGNSQVTYSPEHLCENFFSSSEERFYSPNGHLLPPDNFQLYYLNTPAWAEGADGNGLGEYLNIEFKEETGFITILNGYVDIDRPHLYKDNGRIRTVKIISYDPGFEIIITLEDEVKFQTFNFPEDTDKIRLEIIDVYPGEKYSDTCITAILADRWPVEIHDW